MLERRLWLYIFTGELISGSAAGSTRVSSHRTGPYRLLRTRSRDRWSGENAKLYYERHDTARVYIIIDDARVSAYDAAASFLGLVVDIESRGVDFLPLLLLRVHGVIHRIKLGYGEHEPRGVLQGDAVLVHKASEQHFACRYRVIFLWVPMLKLSVSKTPGVSEE